MDSKLVLLTVLLGVSALACSSHAASCTFYGSPGEKGAETASGTPFDASAFAAAALPHIPIGSVVRVENMRNGRSVQVKVNDRFGSPPSEDSIDLTYSAFGQIASHSDGVVPCSYTIL